LRSLYKLQIKKKEERGESFEVVELEKK